MKKFLITLLSFVALAGTLAAQNPKGFNYQMVVRDNAGKLVNNRNVSVRLNIRQGSESGTSVYMLDSNFTTNANGLVSFIVGQSSEAARYAAIDWNNGPYYIVSEVDPDGGTNYTLTTKQQILAVPYAEHARVADSVSSSFSEADPKFVAWGYAYSSLVGAPDRLSQFINDLDFLTANDLLLTLNGDTLCINGVSCVVLPKTTKIDWDSVINHPTRLSQFQNDLTLEWDSIVNHPTNLSQFYNDLTLEWDSIVNHPTNLSQFYNDLNIEWDSIVNRPDSLSQFINNITIDWDSIVNRPSNLSQYFNDLNVEWDSIINHPTNLSQFYNDLNLEWDSIINRPTNLSQFNNDLNLEWDSIINHPTNLSQFYNDLNLEWDSIINHPTNLSEFNNDITIHWDSIIGRPDSLGNVTVVETQDLYNVLQHGNNANNLIITGLRGPVNNTDVTNKYYVDSLVNAEGDRLDDRIDSLANALNNLANDVADSLDSINNRIRNINNNFTTIIGDEIGDSLDAMRDEIRDSIIILNNLIDSLNGRIDSLANALFEQQHELIDGELPGIFSVGNGKKVRFSKGNLQYRPFIDTWRFANTQTDAVYFANNNIGQNCNVWIDLFGFGTSGWKGGGYNHDPYSYSPVSIDYTDSAQGNDLKGLYANSDWGFYNHIMNGGNQPGVWRTLSFAEWTYILQDRPNAANLRGVAKIDGIPGYIILPDNWVAPAGVTFPNTSSDGYSSAQWAAMEAAGAVFLVAGGSRLITSTSDDDGYYWTSTHAGSTTSYSIHITETGIAIEATNAAQGCSVRVVRDYK